MNSNKICNKRIEERHEMFIQDVHIQSNNVITKTRFYFEYFITKLIFY